MSLNKHKIIPLIESYYHTFTRWKEQSPISLFIILKSRIFLPEIFRASLCI